jgi:hypothetical protein
MKWYRGTNGDMWGSRRWIYGLEGGWNRSGMGNSRLLLLGFGGFVRFGAWLGGLRLWTRRKG